MCLLVVAALTGCWSKGSHPETKEAASAPSPKATGGTSKVRPECVEITRTFESALPALDDDQPLANINAIRKAAEEAGEDPASCVRDRIETLLRREREKLVWLSVAGNKAPSATVIYACPKLQDGLACKDGAADDTAHGREFERSPVVYRATDPVSVNFRDGYRPGNIRVYQIIAHDGEPIPVERSADGTLKLDDFTEGSRVLFAVIEEPSGFVKYVWVLRAGA